MRQHIRRTRHRFFKTTIWKTRLIFWGGAVLVGIVAAVFALLGDQADHIYRNLFEARPWLSFIVTPLGLMLIVWLTRRFFPGAEGSGIPQTLIAIEGRGGKPLAEQLLSFRIAVGKVLLTVMGLFSGASIGREGPTVHLGAAIMYSLGRYVHLPAQYLERGLIMTGGGAGIAAAFNTPIAGIVFAIEEMARSFDRRNSSMILIGVILAGMTGIYVHQDNYNYYGTSPADIDFGWVWLGVAVCGVVGGLLGGAFSYTLINGARRLRPLVRQHAILLAGANRFLYGIGRLCRRDRSAIPRVQDPRHCRVLPERDTRGYFCAVAGQRRRSRQRPGRAVSVRTRVDHRDPRHGRLFFRCCADPDHRIRDRDGNDRQPGPRAGPDGYLPDRLRRIETDLQEANLLRACGELHDCAPAFCESRREGLGTRN